MMDRSGATACGRLSEITIPSFLIGGLQDGYRDNMTDMLMKSKAPIKAIVGPWNHSFPNDADFGPRVEWRDQAVRWFDYWLKGRDTGVTNDPRLVIYMQHWHPPDPNLEERAGRVAARRCVAAAGARRRRHCSCRAITTLASNQPSARYASIEICSDDWRGSGILVGRIAERSAPGRRVQPGL